MSDGKEGLVNKENERNRERQMDRDVEKRYAEANRGMRESAMVSVIELKGGKERDV